MSKREPRPIPQGHDSLKPEERLSGGKMDTVPVVRIERHDNETLQQAATRALDLLQAQGD